MSEHGDESESHKPVRRRREHSDAPPMPASLQLVETSSEVQAPAPIEDELPRRTKPRRRKGGPVEAAPLVLVETQPNEESPPAQAESPASPPQ